MATKSSSTKNRRQSATASKAPAQTRQSKAKGDGAKAMAAVLDSEQFKNSVVGRRIAFIQDDKVRQDLAKRFVAGESMGTLAAEANLTHTRASYCLRQEAVNSGLVPPVGTSLEELIAASAESQYSDAAWVACRSGLTPQKIAGLKAEA